MNTDNVTTVDLIDSVKDWRLRGSKRKWCGEMSNCTKTFEIMTEKEWKWRSLC